MTGIRGTGQGVRRRESERSVFREELIPGIREELITRLNEAPIYNNIYRGYFF